MLEISLSVEGVSVTVPAGTHTAVIGPPACGASTLLRIIAGDVRPQSGEVRIGTRVVTELPRRRRPLLYAMPDAEAPGRWLLARGEVTDSARALLEWAAGRCDASSAILYRWADEHSLATPFVAEPRLRSTVTVTIDFDEAVSADTLAKTLRRNAIVDTESYRKLGRNQLRVACFPAVDPDDVEKLTRAIDYLIDALIP